MDGRLEVRLLSVHHHPHVLLLCILEDLVQPVNLDIYLLKVFKSFGLVNLDIYFLRFYSF